MSWREYWNGVPAVYVSDRHLHAHSVRVAHDICHLIGQFEREQKMSPRGLRAGPRVLDFGCGEALAVDKVVACTGHLFLCDGAARVRATLCERFGQAGNVTVLAPEDLRVIDNASLDLIVANSVVQYLSRSELCGLLDIWQPKLAAEGQLLIGDVIPPDQSAVADAMSLMRFGARNGFFLASVGGLVRMFFSDYRKIRSELGLSCYREAEMLELLERADFHGRRHYPNIGHNQARMAFVARAGRPDD